MALTSIPLGEKVRVWSREECQYASRTCIRMRPSWFWPRKLPLNMFASDFVLPTPQKGDLVFSTIVWLIVFASSSLKGSTCSFLRRMISSITINCLLSIQSWETSIPLASCNTSWGDGSARIALAFMKSLFSTALAC